MCGFIGVHGPSASSLKDGVVTALGHMIHRGPDGQGVYASPDGWCILGHVRLAIIDLSDAAAQPMVKYNCSLVYNGEIYNHNTLRKALVQGDLGFDSLSDTETLLVGLRQQGCAFLNVVSGMFAGAFYDEQSGRLDLFRDPLGIKPLYVASLADSTIIFGSEIAALLSVTNQIQRKVNVETLSCYLGYENYPQKETLIENVESLLPGEVRTYFNNSQAEQISLITPASVDHKIPADRNELITQTRILVDRAVSSHLLSDVPIGVYLSGGVDSSLVSCLAARHTQGLTAFTGYFEDQDCYYDERSYSREVASFLGIELNEVGITANDFKHHFDDLILHLGQPRMGMGSFSQYMVSMRAGMKRKVFLAGHGGDELFAGYPIFKAAWLMQNNWVTPQCWKIWAGLNPKEWPWVAYMMFERVTKGRTPMAPTIFSNQNQKYKSIFFDFGNEPLVKLQEYYQEVYLPGLLLVEDSVSMAHSLETRVPLWSPEVIGWANQVKLDKKMPGGVLKGLLRSVAQGIVPDSILSAPKRGFPTPLRKWFRNELLDNVRDRLLSSSDVLDYLMDRRSRELLIKDHASRLLPFALDEHRAHKIWMLLCLESWARQFNMTFRSE